MYLSWNIHNSCFTVSISFPCVLQGFRLFDIFYDSLYQDKPVNRRKIAEFKSLGLEAVDKKDYLSAAGFYSEV